ncbi:MAG: hypothetical protein IPH36_03840 [Saprospiraceae bacterium]|nr:hypothetical protein [Saprospiraceae bacterium]
MIAKMFIFSENMPLGINREFFTLLIQGIKGPINDNFNFGSTKSLVFPLTLEMSKLMRSFILSTTVLLIAMCIAKHNPGPAVPLRQ